MAKPRNYTSKSGPKKKYDRQGREITYDKPTENEFNQISESKAIDRYNAIWERIKTRDQNAKMPNMNSWLDLYSGDPKRLEAALTFLRNERQDKKKEDEAVIRQVMPGYAAQKDRAKTDTGTISQGEAPLYNPNATVGDRIHNTIADLATGLMVGSTEFRRPTEKELRKGRGSTDGDNWAGRRDLLKQAAIWGTADYLTGYTLPIVTKAMGQKGVTQIGKQLMNAYLDSGFSPTALQKVRYGRGVDPWTQKLAERRRIPSRDLSSFYDDVMYGPNSSGVFTQKESNQALRNYRKYLDKEGFTMEEGLGPQIHEMSASNVLKMYPELKNMDAARKFYKKSVEDNVAREDAVIESMMNVRGEQYRNPQPWDDIAGDASDFEMRMAREQMGRDADNGWPLTREDYPHLFSEDFSTLASQASREATYSRMYRGATNNQLGPETPGSISNVRNNLFRSISNVRNNLFPNPPEEIIYPNVFRIDPPAPTQASQVNEPMLGPFEAETGLPFWQHRRYNTPSVPLDESIAQYNKYLDENVLRDPQRPIPKPVVSFYDFKNSTDDLFYSDDMQISEYRQLMDDLGLDMDEVMASQTGTVNLATFNKIYPELSESAARDYWKRWNKDRVNLEYAERWGPVNRSQQSKKDALTDPLITSPETKKVLEDMEDEDFLETVIKPGGRIEKYNNETVLPQGITPMNVEEYLKKINENLPRLNELIGERNHSGTPYTVSRLNAGNAGYGQLEFDGPTGKAQWGINITPGRFTGQVEDINNTDYYKNIPGISFSDSSPSVFGDGRARQHSGAYYAINDFLKELELGRAKPGFNSQSTKASGAWQHFMDTGSAYGFFANKESGSMPVLHGAMRAFPPVIGTLGLKGAIDNTKEKKYSLGGDIALGAGMGAASSAFVAPPWGAIVGGVVGGVGALVKSKQNSAAMNEQLEQQMQSIGNSRLQQYNNDMEANISIPTFGGRAMGGPLYNFGGVLSDYYTPMSRPMHNSMYKNGGTVGSAEASKDPFKIFPGPWSMNENSTPKSSDNSWMWEAQNLAREGKNMLRNKLYNDEEKLRLYDPVYRQVPKTERSRRSTLIKDNRVIDPISGEKVNDRNRFTVEADTNLVNHIIDASFKKGQDPYRMLAMALQETTLGTHPESRSDFSSIPSSNVLRVTGDTSREMRAPMQKKLDSAVELAENDIYEYLKGYTGDDVKGVSLNGLSSSKPHIKYYANGKWHHMWEEDWNEGEGTPSLDLKGIEKYVKAYNDAHTARADNFFSTRRSIDMVDEGIDTAAKLFKLGKAQGYTTDEDIIQTYNGRGVLSEMDSGDLSIKKAYGLDMPIDMKKNPVYGKRIVNLRDSVIKRNPYITSRVERERMKNKEYMLGGDINKINEKHNMGWFFKNGGPADLNTQQQDTVKSKIPAKWSMDDLRRIRMSDFQVWPDSTDMGHVADYLTDRSYGTMYGHPVADTMNALVNRADEGQYKYLEYLQNIGGAPVTGQEGLKDYPYSDDFYKGLLHIKKDTVKNKANGGPIDREVPASLFKVDKRAFVDSTLNANKNLDWVKRLRMNPTPDMQIPGVEGRSTHYMGDDGQGYVYPNVINQDNGLNWIQHGAEDFARQTNTGIQFKNPEQGSWFAADGYKRGTGVLGNKAYGGPLKAGGNFPQGNATFAEAKKFMKLYPEEMEFGIETEYEHTGNKKLAMRIAADHIKDSIKMNNGAAPDYYKRLQASGISDELNNMPLMTMANGGQLSSSKASEILKDGKVYGKPLSERQKRYMGFISNQEQLGYGGMTYGNGGPTDSVGMMPAQRIEGMGQEAKNWTKSWLTSPARQEVLRQNMGSAGMGISNKALLDETSGQMLNMRNTGVQMGQINSNDPVSFDMNKRNISVSPTLGERGFNRGAAMQQIEGGVAKSLGRGQYTPQETAVSRITNNSPRAGLDSNPTDTYSNIMGFRLRAGLKPERVIGSGDIQQWRQNGMLQQSGLGNYDDATLMSLFNQVAQNTGQSSPIPYAAMGGSIIGTGRILDTHSTSGNNNNGTDNREKILTEYNTGGTHEQNRYGGIQLGGKGKVESGEYRFDDPDTGESYIFSNRY